MASLSSNLKILMSLSKINASELARRTGIAQPIIHRLSTGQNVNPKLATIKPISRYFMVTVSQLIGEDALPNEPVQIPADSEQRAWNRVPLISWRDAVKWPELIQQQKNIPNVSYITTDAPVSKQAYSLVIKDHGMEPLFPQGTTIIVEPKRQPHDRDFVLVHVPGEEEAKLRQVVIDGSNEPYVKSLNSAAEEGKITRLSEAGQFLGVMAQAKVDF